MALNAENGNLIWELQSDFMPSRRGIVVDNNKKANEENLFAAIGDVVYKINAKNGKVVKKFGKNGEDKLIKNYGIGAQIIKALNIKKMILVTRSKKKVIGLDGYGIKITKQEIIK